MRDLLKNEYENIDESLEKSDLSGMLNESVDKKNLNEILQNKIDTISAFSDFFESNMTIYEKSSLLGKDTESIGERDVTNSLMEYFGINDERRRINGSSNLGSSFKSFFKKKGPNNLNFENLPRNLKKILKSFEEGLEDNNGKKLRGFKHIGVLKKNKQENLKNLEVYYINLMKSDDIQETGDDIQEETENIETKKVKVKKTKKTIIREKKQAEEMKKMDFEKMKQKFQKEKKKLLKIVKRYNLSHKSKFEVSKYDVLSDGYVVSESLDKIADDITQIDNIYDSFMEFKGKPTKSKYESLGLKDLNLHSIEGLEPSETGKKVVSKAIEMTKSDQRGKHCRDWANKVFMNSYEGQSNKIYYVKKYPKNKPPYDAPVAKTKTIKKYRGNRNKMMMNEAKKTLKPGDRLYINNRNNADRNGNHSVIFLGRDTNGKAKVASLGRGVLKPPKITTEDFNKKPIVYIGRSV